MTSFEATVTDEADISAPRQEVWDALTDPYLLPKLTPLVTGITPDGDIWVWEMMRIAALGVSVAPKFTERMSFEPGRVISYTHEPPGGAHERAGTEGRYELCDIPGGTHLSIRLTMRVDLPLPRASARAVNRIMQATMDRTGETFAQNLLDHLGAHRL